MYTAPSHQRQCPRIQNPADHLSHVIEVDDFCSLDQCTIDYISLLKNTVASRCQWLILKENDTSNSSGHDTRTSFKYWTIQFLLKITKHHYLLFGSSAPYRQSHRFSHAHTSTELAATWYYWICKVQERSVATELAILLK